MWLAVLWLTGASIKRNKETLDRVVNTKRLLFVYLLLPLVVLYHQWNDVHVLQMNPLRWLSYSALMLQQVPSASLSSLQE